MADSNTPWGVFALGVLLGVAATDRRPRRRRRKRHVAARTARKRRSSQNPKVGGSPRATMERKCRMRKR